MCRWLAYLGSPIWLEDALVRPNHSLLDQGLLARDLFLPGDPIAKQFPRSAFPTNGDGFGVAWRGRDGRLGQFRQIEPVWDSQNFRHLAAQISSGCFLGHVRAAPGGTIAEQNCHPFVMGGWMFQHNGMVPEFARLRRELMMEVDPDLFPAILGNSDTETLFALALTLGLENDPVGALRRLVDRVERARADAAIEAPFEATICASDGERLVTLRWISPDAEAPAPTLFSAAGPTMLRTEAGGEDRMPDGAQLVVSEPLELHWSPRTWHEIPNATIGVFRRDEKPEFTPIGLPGA